MALDPLSLDQPLLCSLLALVAFPCPNSIKNESDSRKETVPDYTPESRPYLRLCDLPTEERPRERLNHVGEQALSTTELLAIVIGSGHGNDNVLQLAQLLLSDLDGLSGLARALIFELR